MRYAILGVVILAAIVVWVIARRQSPPTFPSCWDDRLATGMAVGQVENRPVLVLFHASPLSETSRKLLNEVLTGKGREEAFAKHRYVLVHVPTSTKAPLAIVWSIQTLPTMVILDSAGQVVKRHEGYIDASTFWNEFILPPPPASRPATRASAPGS
ncbi:MAG: hypothetical protein NTV86_15765 [Planctomycetota bacterium]|nr:hypothetical protein [Planctomycetota bacterium]